MFLIYCTPGFASLHHKQFRRPEKRRKIATVAVGRKMRCLRPKAESAFFNNKQGRNSLFEFRSKPENSHRKPGSKIETKFLIYYTPRFTPWIKSFCRKNVICLFRIASSLVEGVSGLQCKLENSGAREDAIEYHKKQKRQKLLNFKELHFEKNKIKKECHFWHSFCGSRGSRTPDPLLVRQML